MQAAAEWQEGVSTTMYVVSTPSVPLCGKSNPMRIDSVAFLSTAPYVVPQHEVGRRAVRSREYADATFSGALHGCRLVGCRLTTAALHCIALRSLCRRLPRACARQ